MGEGKLQKCQKFKDQWSSPNNKMDPWMIMNEDQKDSNNNIDAASSPVSSIHEDSTISNGSCSSSNDKRDDASSLATSSSNSSSNSSETLYDLSDLMAQLPLKRGLSKFYQGKSESFTCLSKVTSIEDLAKKESSPYNRRRKNKGISKSFEGGLDAFKSFTRPKANISKKNPRASVSSSFLNRRASFSNGSSRPPLIPSDKELLLITRCRDLNNFSG